LKPGTTVRIRERVPMKTPKPFAKEADLCAAFIEALPDSWTAYPETAGWDILLVRKKDGFQIGIQAKLRLNTDVINQAIDEYGYWSAADPGPDCRALLVPESKGFARICQYLALVVITPSQPISYGPKATRSRWRFDPSLPEVGHYLAGDWPEWAPATRCKLPAYVPDVIAGASAPTQLTDWKIKALKLAVLLEKNGAVQRTDFKHLQLDHRRWVEGRWLSITPNGGFIAGSNWPDFKRAHPRVYVEIEADFEKWKPNPTPNQKALL
jgi:hypothetical protein